MFQSKPDDEQRDSLPKRRIHKTTKKLQKKKNKIKRNEQKLPHTFFAQLNDFMVSCVQLDAAVEFRTATGIVAGLLRAYALNDSAPFAFINTNAHEEAPRVDAILFA